MMHRAGELRHEPTPAEAKLWKYLRSLPLDGTHFRRHTCPGGRCQRYAIENYIVDFCAPRAKLIIEVDGSQHIDQRQYDIDRTEFLKAKGYRVLQFWNNDILNNVQSVMSTILQAIPNQQLTYISGEGK
jgi:very-short-patch-repair endonuclease